jgi:hypothetical protein
LIEEIGDGVGGLDSIQTVEVELVLHPPLTAAQLP